MAESEAKSSGNVEEEPEATGDTENECKSGMVAPPKFVFGQNMEGRVKRQGDEQSNPDTEGGDDVNSDDCSHDESGEYKKVSSSVMSQRSTAKASSSLKDKAGSVGGSNQSIVAAGFPAPSKPLFSTGDPTDRQPTSPTITATTTASISITTTASTSHVGPFSGQTLSFASSAAGMPSFTSPGTAPTLTTTTAAAASSATFQSQQTSAATAGSYTTPNNAVKNVFAAAGVGMPPDPSKNVFATHGTTTHVPTITSNVFAQRESDDVSSTQSGNLSISSVGAVTSGTHSGLSNITHYRTTTAYKLPGSGYSSVENSDTEQDESRPVLKTPLLVVSSPNKPVLSAVSSSSSLEDSKEHGSSGHFSSSRNILKPSALTAQTVALQTSKLSPLIKPALVSSPDTKTENKDKKERENEVENGATSSTEDGVKENGQSRRSGFTTGTKESFFVRLQQSDESKAWLKPHTMLSSNFAKEGMSVFKQDSDSAGSGSNYWSQFSKSTESFSSASKEKHKVEKEQENSFVFGKNLDGRISKNLPTKRPLDEEESEGSVDSDESRTKRVKETAADSESEASSKTLEESASAYEEAKKSSRLKLDEVPTVTGEESEENVLQAQCKLFLFDPANHSWLEKGRGMLRINDLSRSTDVLSFQSRLVMRTQGSLRVILNTKIWPKMAVEKASPKSVRITAMDSEGAKVFLIMANPKDAEQIFSAIDYRVQALKRYEEVQEERKESSGSQDSSTHEAKYADSQVDSFKSKTEERRQVSEEPPSPPTEDQI